jgi:hypothetical protein
MSKKKRAATKEKRLSSNRKLILLSIILVSIVVLGSALSFILLQTPNRFSLNAAIIDQLGEDFPNQEFVTDATDILKAAGFNVTYYESKDVNVTFYAGLAKDNYGIIILRVHSALRSDNSTVDLFTSEEFTLDEYPQYDGLLTNGSYLWRPNKYYFAISSGFIENLEGQFPKSVVIAMGCWSLKPGLDQMAKAFISKGAQVYIGWTDMVEPDHTDNETIRLLKMLLEENETMLDAVSNIAPDWSFAPPAAKMRYCPPTDAVGSLRISDLITEAEDSMISKSQLTIVSYYPDLMLKKIRYKSKNFRRVVDLAGSLTASTASKQLCIAGFGEHRPLD